MAAPEQPWKAEYAKSSRASCRTCRCTIGKEVLRLGEMVQSQHFDGFMPMWHHAACVMEKAKQIRFVDEVEGLETLRWEDQLKLRKYIEGNGASVVAASRHRTLAPEAKANGIQVSQNSLATCKCCREKIIKGEWYHTECFIKLFPSTLPNNIPGWDSVPPSDQASLQSAIKGGTSTSAESGLICVGECVTPTSTKRESDGGSEPHGQYLKLVKNDSDMMMWECVTPTSTKRERDGGSEPHGQYLKLVKTDSDMTMWECVTPTSTPGNGVEKADLERSLEAQSRELWKLKDDLKKYVSTSELRQMLKMNNQSTYGSQSILRERCGERMMFGALKKCSICSGNFHYSGGKYTCAGHLSEWSKCSFTTTQPGRFQEKWKIPENTKNEFLLKWSKSEKAVKPVKLLPPQSLNSPSRNQTSNGQHRSSKEEYLGDFRVSMVKVKEGSAIDEASGLQDSGHILEEGSNIYNTTLSLSDLSRGINSYYILQIIQDDVSPRCHVFRKWGRVGYDIGKSKLELFSKEAFEQFKRLFLEKTGNLLWIY